MNSGYTPLPGESSGKAPFKYRTYANCATGAHLTPVGKVDLYLTNDFSAAAEGFEPRTI